MIGTIEGAAIAGYGAPMHRAALRLFALIALLLMPFGMAAAPAAPADEHHSAAMAMEHCPDGQDRQQDPGGNIADCAMPCSAALPAADLSPASAIDLPRAPAEPAFQIALSGILLEIATPPPKRA